MVSDGFLAKVRDIQRLRGRHRDAVQTDVHVRRILPADVAREPVPPPSADDLTRQMMAHFRPHARSLVYLAGHGSGTDVGGIHLDTLALALDRLREANQIVPEFIFLEACAMGHVPGLVRLADKAGVAIVSEEMIPVDAFPTEAMLEEAMGDGTPQEVAARMIETAGKRSIGRGGPRAVAAVDLGRIKGLAQSTQQLLDAAAAAPLGVLGPAIKEAMWCLPRAAKQFRFADVGVLARQVAKREGFPAAARQHADAVTEGLRNTVLRTARNGEYYGISGLTFKAELGGTEYSWWDLMRY